MFELSNLTICLPNPTETVTLVSCSSEMQQGHAAHRCLPCFVKHNVKGVLGDCAVCARAGDSRGMSPGGTGQGKLVGCQGCLVLTTFI